MVSRLTSSFDYSQSLSDIHGRFPEDFPESRLGKVVGARAGHEDAARVEQA